ncbi:hypothetical protein Tco_0215224 [Tanacetum coccineum]
MKDTCRYLTGSCYADMIVRCLVRMFQRHNLRVLKHYEWEITGHNGDWVVKSVDENDKMWRQIDEQQGQHDTRTRRA